MITIRQSLVLFLLISLLSHASALGIRSFSSSNSRVSPGQVRYPTLQERGTLHYIQDSGYPFVVLTIDFPERQYSMDFTLNLEEVKGVNMNILKSWLGKRVAFEYNSDTVNALLDLDSNGKSVLNEYPIPIDDNARSVYGRLSNAEFETTGDVPGEIYVTTEEEVTYKFPFFITSDIVKLNGTMVMAWYEERTANTMIAIELVP